MGAPKDSMEGQKVIPSGRYTVILDGFKPKISKNKDNPSVNFWPQLRIVNHPQFSGVKLKTALNQGAGFILEAFTHMLGGQMELVEDQAVLPGHWLTDPANPADYSKFRYQGPLVGQQGELELGENEYKNRKQNYIKQYFCRVPGCKKEHPTELS
jgi:hypothetical protein